MVESGLLRRVMYSSEQYRSTPVSFTALLMIMGSSPVSVSTTTVFPAVMCGSRPYSRKHRIQKASHTECPFPSWKVAALAVVLGSESPVNPSVFSSALKYACAVRSV